MGIGFDGMSRRSFGRVLAGTAAAGLTGFGRWSEAQAATFEPALIYDYGGKFDRSFNQAAYDGAERFKQETGLTYREFEITNESQREQSMLQLAKRGAALIVGVGFGHQAAMTKVATQYPKVRFTIIDAVVDLPNVQSIVFREQECCFLVGMIAALTSKTGKIGFVGGMDVPLIRRFAAGYAEGAKFARPDVEVLQTMTGTTVSAWNDPARGSELARSQFDRGADVVFAAAGATGLGVLQAAADAGKFSVGCDSNQNALHPGSVLTSMVKRVDVATYNAMMAAKDDKWQGGRMSLGLKEDGLDYAIDDNNRSLIPPDIKARVDRAKAEIIAGKLVPTDVAAQ
jgi:basic membrane protein A